MSTESNLLREIITIRNTKRIETIAVVNAYKAYIATFKKEYGDGQVPDDLFRLGLWESRMLATRVDDGSRQDVSLPRLREERANLLDFDNSRDINKSAVQGREHN